MVDALLHGVQHKRSHFGFVFVFVIPAVGEKHLEEVRKYVMTLRAVKVFFFFFFLLVFIFFKMN